MPPATPIELDRRRRRVPRGKFDSGGDADPLLHRRQQITILGIEHRTAERRALLGPEVAMVAALDGERQLDAEEVRTSGAHGPSATPRRRNRSGRIAVSTRQ